MDIFYQELSFERIEQNEAFEFSSLLSEIGGFLGLLLGASVLTVFELVDYLALHSMNKLNVQANQQEVLSNSPEKKPTKEAPKIRATNFKSWL